MNKTPIEILDALDEKFSANFSEWKKLDGLDLTLSFKLLRGVAAVGQVLTERASNQNQIYCCKIFDEIFSDATSSIYLSANGMFKPASIVLRRVTELGVAGVYLWDMPHMTFMWKNHDEDLSFSTMLKHVNSKGYLDFVSAELGKSHPIAELYPMQRCQSLYGDLSDIAHGKISTFESDLANSFQFRKRDWEQFLGRCNSILKIILSACVYRFNMADELLAVDANLDQVVK